MLSAQHSDGVVQGVGGLVGAGYIGGAENVIDGVGDVWGEGVVD